MGWLVARTIVHPGFFPFPSSFLGTYNVDLNGSQTLTQRGDQAPFYGLFRGAVGSWPIGVCLRFVCLGTHGLPFPPSSSAPLLASVSEDCSLAVLDSGLSDV